MTAPKGINPEEIWHKHQQGVTSTRIAIDLGIARNTVNYHLKQLKKRMGAEPDNSNSQESTNPEGSSTTDNGGKSVPSPTENKN
jgi:hypothetical protein